MIKIRKKIFKSFSIIFSFMLLFISVQNLDVKADSSDPYNRELISIIVNGHRINIPSTSTSQFNVALPKSTESDYLHVIAEPVNKKATVTIEGNRLINNTAVVKIIVTSENKLSSYTYYVNVQVKDSELSGSFKDIKSTDYHSLALKKDGTLYAFGENSFGQLGDGTKTNRKSPVQVKNLSGVVDFDTSSSHSIAVTVDGSVWVWGLNDNGQLYNKNKEDILTPMKVMGITGIVKVRAGNRFSLALDKYGTVWFMGYNPKGQFEDEVNTSNLRPRIVSGLSNVKVKDIAAGDFHCMALSSTGRVYSWGANDFGQLGDGTTNVSYSPGILPNSENDTFTNANVRYIDANGNTSICVKMDGTAYLWGKSSFIEENKTISIISPKNIGEIIGEDTSKFIDINVNSNHMVLLKNNGKIFTMGNNQNGQLGTGVVSNWEDFKEIYNIERMNKITTSIYNTFLIGEDGYIYACGKNNIGQLGIDVTGESYKSLQKLQGISGDNNVDMVYANYNSGEVDYNTEIKLKTDTPYADIYYTLDGTDPTENSILYTKPIIIKEYTVIKAVAVYIGRYSAVSTHEYFISSKARTEMNINIEAKKSKMGEMMEIPITFTNVPASGIASVKFAVKYNPEVMSFDSVSYGELIQQSGDFSYTASQGTVIFNFSDTSRTSRNITQDGVFAVLKLYVRYSIPSGRYSIAQSYVIDEGAYHKDNKAINVYYKNGYVDVDSNTILYGDVDGDGVITAKDLQYVHRYIENKISTFPSYNGFEAADLDKDGRLTSNDVQMIKKLILK